MSGNFGYELDLTQFSDQEKEIVKQQIQEYKQVRGLVQQGELYRLKSPFENNETAWMFVSADRREALVYYFRVMAEPNPARSSMRLAGLEPEYEYMVVNRNGEEVCFGGDRLMQVGVSLEYKQADYMSGWFKLKAVD